MWFSVGFCEQLYFSERLARQGVYFEQNDDFCEVKNGVLLIFVDDLQTFQGKERSEYFSGLIICMGIVSLESNCEQIA